MHRKVAAGRTRDWLRCSHYRRTPTRVALNQLHALKYGVTRQKDRPVAAGDLRRITTRPTRCVDCCQPSPWPLSRGNGARPWVYVG